MISATKLRAGVTFVYESVPYRVNKYRHSHVSRGGGSVKLKTVNLEDGRKKSFTFKSSESFEEIVVERRELQFLYRQDGELFFMDPRNYEQLSLKQVVVGEKAKFLQEGQNVFVLFWGERALNVDVPPKVVLEVVKCDPGAKGNSASNVYKGAVLEGEVSVRVPLFVKVEDKVRVDTRSGEYVERAN